MLKPVPLDLLGYCIYCMGWSATTTGTCPGFRNAVMSMILSITIVATVCLIWKKRQHCWNAHFKCFDSFLVWMMGWPGYIHVFHGTNYFLRHIDLIQPCILQCQFFYQQLGSSIYNHLSAWWSRRIHQGGREMYVARGVFSESITWICVSSMLTVLQMLGTVTHGKIGHWFFRWSDFWD